MASNGTRKQKEKNLRRRNMRLEICDGRWTMSKVSSNGLIAMSSRQSVQKLLDFLKVGSRLEKSPSFSGALGLNPESVSASQVAFDLDKQNLTFRLPLTQRIRLPRQETVALSTYLAIIDDVTTWALILGDPKRSRPGVSLSLRGEWGPSQSGRGPGEEVDIVTTVNKIGRNMGFVRAEVRDAATGPLVCSASHVKYLPMGMLLDLMLSSYGWNATKLYTEHVLSPPASPTGDPPPLVDLFQSLKFLSDNRASFEPAAIHASLGGPMHGGCQAIVMELAATKVAMRELGVSAVRLDSMHVEYMSAPSSKMVEVDVQIDSKAEASSSVSLRVQLLGGGKLKSEGTLRFSPVSQSKL
jgi:acyl-coenzyme A thioesterase PaaI-like protein